MLSSGATVSKMYVAVLTVVRAVPLAHSAALNVTLNAPSPSPDGTESLPVQVLVPFGAVPERDSGTTSFIGETDAVVQLPLGAVEVACRDSVVGTALLKNGGETVPVTR